MLDRDSLTNTWGIVDSDDHADYIVSMAVANDIKVNRTAYKCNFFTFIEDCKGLSLWIYSRESCIDKGRCNKIEVKMPSLRSVNKKSCNDVIKTTSYDQLEILENITNLYLCGESFDLDPTYSKGKFYENGRVKQPRIKSDLIPRFDDVNDWDASSLGLNDSSIKSICFDPPFIVGHTKDKPTGIIGERFHGFRYIKDLWDWYSKCLVEFYRVLDKNGVLVFKCQDTVSSGKQYLSHVHIINEAERLGFYCRDMFILNAKNRIIGHNHHNQKHARKFHSYFLVFEKRKVNL